MTWAYVAVGAAVVVGGAMSQQSSNDASATAAKNANNSAYKNYTNAVKTTMENNEAIGEANTTNMIRAGYRVGLINLQTARLKEQAAQQGYAASKTGMEALATTEANAAASGTIGASVDAAANDIKKKSEEAQIAVAENWKDTLENQNIQIHQLVDSATDAMVDVQTIPDINAVNTVAPTTVQALGSVVSSLGSMYASSQVNVGNAGASTAGTNQYGFSTAYNTTSQYSSATLGGVYGSYRVGY